MKKFLYDHQDYLFVIILSLTLAIFLYIGIYFNKNAKPPTQKKIIISQFNVSLQTNYTEKPKIEKKNQPQKTKKRAPEKKSSTQKALKKFIVNKKETTISNNKEEQKVEKTTKKKIRKIYGLKRVFSHGLGSSGDLSNAIISKQGNTLEKEIDTITPTKEEIKGKIATIATISSPPKIIKMVKPKYPKEMLKKGIEGVVKVKVLIDIDGKVKKILFLNDLGYGSKEEVIKACKQIIFEPAKINNKPVAVWITIKFPFRLIDS